MPLGLEGVEQRREDEGEGPHQHHPWQVQPRGDHRHKILRGQVPHREGHDRGRVCRGLHPPRRRQAGIYAEVREGHLPRLRPGRRSPQGRRCQPDDDAQGRDRADRQALRAGHDQEVRPAGHRPALRLVQHDLRRHPGATGRDVQDVRRRVRGAEVEAVRGLGGRAGRCGVALRQPSGEVVLQAGGGPDPRRRRGGRAGREAVEGRPLHRRRRLQLLKHHALVGDRRGGGRARLPHRHGGAPRQGQLPQQHRAQAPVHHARGRDAGAGLHDDGGLPARGQDHRGGHVGRLDAGRPGRRGARENLAVEARQVRAQHRPRRFFHMFEGRRGRSVGRPSRCGAMRLDTRRR
mmetsp:Transcript_17357/g.48725  ORF Transcript_17357/g.48725 Transcript_17357/m.48725 type:complete len:348 (-) Transcript_17357:9-1052(-)